MKPEICFFGVVSALCAARRDGWPNSRITAIRKALENIAIEVLDGCSDAQGSSLILTRLCVEKLRGSAAVPAALLAGETPALRENRAFPRRRASPITAQRW